MCWIYPTTSNSGGCWLVKALFKNCDNGLQVLLQVLWQTQHMSGQIVGPRALPADRIFAWEEILEQRHEDSQVIAFDLRHIGVSQGAHEHCLL